MLGTVYTPHRFTVLRAQTPRREPIGVNESFDSLQYFFHGGAFHFIYRVETLGLRRSISVAQRSPRRFCHKAINRLSPHSCTNVLRSEYSDGSCLLASQPRSKSKHALLEHVLPLAVLVCAFMLSNPGAGAVHAAIAPTYSAPLQGLASGMTPLFWHDDLVEAYHYAAAVVA